jgi:hypothetical protein
MAVWPHLETAQESRRVVERGEKARGAGTEEIIIKVGGEEEEEARVEVSLSLSLLLLLPGCAV